MSILKEPIDYKGLERELEEALRADELYKLQNDAKFRAIEQSVPTYDHFKELVNGAHLKPLERKDKTPKIGVRWNSAVSDKSSEYDDNKWKIDRQLVRQISSTAAPRNAHEFRQAWKGIVDYREKLELLSIARLDLRTTIFRSEIPPDVLHDAIRTCLETLKTFEKSPSCIIDILITLSRCNRFHLAVSFMSENERIVCKELFELLRSSSSTENEDLVEIAVLEKSYIP